MRKIFCKLKFFLIPCKVNKYRPEFFNTRFLFYYAIFLFILKIAVIPFFIYFPQTAFFANLTKNGLIEMTNSARASFGFQPLKENYALSQAAYIKAKDMIERGYFDHYCPEGNPPWYWLEKIGYSYISAGENLAIGFLESEQVHLAWMDSHTHKQNILNPGYQEIGIAVLTGNFQGNETTLVVQFFGAPRIALADQQEPMPIVREREEITKVPETLSEKQDFEELESDTDESEERDTDISDSDVLDADTILLEAQEQDDLDKEKHEELQEETASALLEQGEIKKTPSLALFGFITSKYYDIVQKIIYGSLALIIFYLIIAFFCDIFVYRKFKVDYKDVIFKTIGFFILWSLLLFLDKMVILELINPQNFRIF